MDKLLHEVENFQTQIDMQIEELEVYNNCLINAFGLGKERQEFFPTVVKIRNSQTRYTSLKNELDMPGSL